MYNLLWFRDWNWGGKINAILGHALSYPRTLISKIFDQYFSGFIPYGEGFGDQYVRKGDDVTTCTPVSPDFPLFTTKGHHQICVSFFLEIQLLAYPH